MNSTYIVFDIADYFCITFVVISWWNRPFQWPKVTMVNLGRQKHNLDPLSQEVCLPNTPCGVKTVDAL